MKKIFIMAFATAMVLSCNSNDEKQQPHILQGAINKVKAQYVPDSRIEVFDIKIKDDNGKIILKGATTNDSAKYELLKLAQSENKNVVDSINILPESALGDKTYGVVTLSVASMRTAGKYSAEMATQGILGMPVKILQGGSWLRVQTPDGYIAYTVSGNIKRMNKADFNAWISAPKIIFTENNGFAYSQENTASQVVSDLTLGNMLKFEGESKTFYKVAYPDGREAYVQKVQAQKFDDWQKNINLTGNDIANYGKRFMGLPYLWGGTSAKALDCSGFAKTVYFMHGVILMRDASQQAYTGQNIDISNLDNLQVGDLLFFGKKAEGDRKERVRHVGIYLGGKQFIHEATQVKIGSLDPNAPNYDEGNATEFIRAARILGSIDTKGISTFSSNPFYQEQK